MENKKTKLTISGGLKKSFKDINDKKNQGKKTVIINRQSPKFPGKGKFSKGSGYKSTSTNHKKADTYKTNFKINNPNSGISDFEKRKLAEQRATKRFKGEDDKDKKSKTSGLKKRDVKLTVSRALSDEIETRERSLASVKRARQKELKNIEGIEEDTAKALIERAKEFYKKDQEDISQRIKDLGISDDLINLKGLTPGMLLTLGEQKILKLEDFADLASDELTGGFDVVKGEKIRIQGYLEDFALSKAEADELIMSARNIVYKD